MGEFRTAFPDLRLIIEEQIAEGDKVVSRATIRGTHLREFRGIAPTGKEMEIPGMAVFRFSSEGKVVSASLAEARRPYSRLRSLNPR